MTVQAEKPSFKAIKARCPFLNRPRKDFSKEEILAIARINLECRDGGANALVKRFSRGDDARYVDLLESWESTRREPVPSCADLKSMSDACRTCKEMVSSPLELINAPVPPSAGSAACIKALGRSPELDVLLWVKGRIHRLKPRNMDYGTLTLLTGFSDGKELQKLRDRLILEAHSAGTIDDERRIGPGVWRIDGGFLINTGHKAVLFRDGKVSTIDEPAYEGRFIEFTGDSAWIDETSLVQALECGTVKDSFVEIYDQVKLWPWAHPEMGLYAAAFAVMAPFQALMSWRPFIFLNGPRGSGKSMFFDFVLNRIYGSLFSGLGKSTAYATAQELGNSAKIGCFDEFEKHRHIGQILELGKLASRGGYRTSGTTGQRATKYKLNHLLWFGGIYQPAEVQSDSAIKSRSVVLELKRPDANGRPPTGFSERQGPIMAGRIVGSMVREWPRIQKERDYMMELASTIAAGDVRALENYTWASTILNLIDGKTRDIPQWALREEEDDGHKIVRCILNSIIRSHDKTVRELLADQDNKQARATLETYGIKRTRAKGVDGLALDCDQVRSKLLKDSEYSMLDIGSALRRLDGAISNHPVTFTGGQTKCLIIPLSYVSGNGGNPEVTSEVTPQSMINKGIEDNSYFSYLKENEKTEIEPESEKMVHQKSLPISTGGHVVTKVTKPLKSAPEEAGRGYQKGYLKAGVTGNLAKKTEIQEVPK